MSNDLCPLQELFAGDELPIEFILSYLHKRNSPGIQAFLVNKLYNTTIKDISFYFPQLLAMAWQREDYGAYSRFFIDITKKNYVLGVKMYWTIQAEMQKRACNKKIESISHDLEKVIVQGHNPLFSQEIPCDIKDFNTIKAEYFTEQFKLAHTMVKISILLIREALDKDTTLKAYITHLDTWLKDTRFWYSRKNSEYVKKLFRGIVLPLDLNESIDQIVRIPSEEAKCFKTKARVPYKIILETVSIIEKDPITLDDQAVENPPNDYLDNLSVDSDSIIDKESARFEGIEEYVNRNFEADRGVFNPVMVVEDTANDPWGERWKETKVRIKQTSPFGLYNTWNAKAYIIKGHDDLRQELLAMQIIKKSKEILDQGNVGVYLRPYEIMIVSDNSGIIECVPDAVSLHTIKKHNNFLPQFFISHWGSKFEEAQKNFVESMAGYSLMCYILNLKDRHNGNILLDSDGHIIHIDFGFFLTNSPGKLNMESAPFKLTREMIELMGGYGGEMLNYFKILFYQGFLVLRKYAGELTLLIEMMLPGDNLPCFYDPNRAAKEFKTRFCLDLSDEQCLRCVEDLIKVAAENWRTQQYDMFQWITNDILY